MSGVSYKHFNSCLKTIHFPLKTFVSICLYSYLLWVTNRLYSGDSLCVAMGLTSRDESIYYCYDSPLEDDDVIQERNEVTAVMQTQENVT